MRSLTVYRLCIKNVEEFGCVQWMPFIKPETLWSIFAFDAANAFCRIFSTIYTDINNDHDSRLLTSQLRKVRKICAISYTVGHLCTPCIKWPGDIVLVVKAFLAESFCCKHGNIHLVIECNSLNVRCALVSVDVRHHLYTAHDCEFKMTNEKVVMNQVWLWSNRVLASPVLVFFAHRGL